MNHDCTNVLCTDFPRANAANARKTPYNAYCYSGTGLANEVVLFLFPRTTYCSAEDTYHPIVRYILDSCIYYLGHPIETVSALGDRRRAPAPESTGAATILCLLKKTDISSASATSSTNLQSTSV
jgi:hypothetical protein